MYVLYARAYGISFRPLYRCLSIREGSNRMSNSLPVAVIGAGPIGLAAAVRLLQQGQTPIVFEAGESVGASILKWGHVRLFTPWRYAVDSACVALLEETGWSLQDPERHPTGAELVEEYLLPLAGLPQLQPHIRTGMKVIRVTRDGFDKMKTKGRENAPFVVTVQNKQGDEEQVLVKAVIDASGTYATPNPLGGNGAPAVGERAIADRVFYGIPNILGEHRERYADKRVVVVGSGASAFNVLLDLVRLSETAPNTHIIWVLRRALTGRVFGGGEADELPERGSLGQRVRALVENGTLEVVPQFSITRMVKADDGMLIYSGDRATEPVDEIIATTGFRPDLSLFSELRLALDPAVESPIPLAEMIDPNFHSCGTVRPHGAEELRHPEQNFYIVGSKSYGRAPTFLLLTGYEQVRSVAAAIAGDWESAREVQLELPQTGVCSSTPDDPVGACCGTSKAAVPSSSGMILINDIAQQTSCCGSPVAVSADGQALGSSCCG
jgi:thioredoxin reductase